MDAGEMRRGERRLVFRNEDEYLTSVGGEKGSAWD